MSFKITITKNGKTTQFEEFNLNDALKHLDDGEITSWVKEGNVEIKCNKY